MAIHSTLPVNVNRALMGEAPRACFLGCFLHILLSTPSGGDGQRGVGSDRKEGRYAKGRTDDRRGAQGGGV